MGNNSTWILLVMKKLLILCIFLDLKSVSSQKLDESQISQWMLGFKQELDSHIDKVLVYGQIEQMLLDFETKLVHAPIDGEEIFNEIFQNVSLRYNHVVLAANRLKQRLEKDVSKLNNVEPPMPVGGPCCCGLGPGPFDGKVRDTVQNRECYGSEDALLKSLSKTEFVNTLKVRIFLEKKRFVSQDGIRDLMICCYVRFTL
jgi:hypothetical protein